MNDKLFKKAINKHKAGKLTEAAQLYKKILKSTPDHLDANYMLGTLLAEQGRLQPALQYLKTAQGLSPQSPLVQNNLGNVYRLLGEYEQAARCYQAALAANAHMPEACNNLAIIYRRLGDDRRAEEFYQHALAVKPDFTEASYNLGKLYWDNAQLEDARASYQRAIEVQPDYAPPYYGLGLCAMKCGDKARAVGYFNSYLAATDTDRYGARLQLAYLSGGELPDKMPEQLVQETYETKAGNWDAAVVNPEMEFLGPQHVRQAVEGLLQDSPAQPGSLTILDIGCGTGLCGDFLKPLARRLEGVDLSRHMLQQAQKKQLYDQLAEADVTDYMAQHPAQYDLITASGVLIFFGDLSPVLLSAAQALKPGGCVIFTAYKSMTADIEIRDNIHFGHSEQHIRQCAGQAGLQVRAIAAVVHEYEKGQPQQGYISVLCKP